MSIAFKRRISGLIAFVMIVSAMLCNAFTAYSESSASPDGSDTVLSSDAVGYDLLANDDGIQLTSAEDGEPVAGETYNVDIKNGDDGGLSTESGSGSWLGGMVTMENATKNGGGHGAQMQSGTKISVKVAGDAKITFYECQYANNTYSITAESETVSPKTMNFGNDKNGCNAPMEFTYTGKATTLVFNVSGTGQAYIHGFNIYNLLPKDEYEYPEKGTTQKYDFTKYVADEGHGLGDDSKYIKINGDVSLNSSDARYGITFSTPVYLLINVAGNAKITLPKDTNNKQGPAVTASALFDGGSIEPSDAQSLQSEEKSCTQFLQNPDSSENVTINYTGEQNVIKLSFAAYRTYMPGVIVENEGDPIPIPEEDYSIDFETEAEAGGLTTAAESKGVWKDGWVSVSSAKKHADNHGIQFGSGTKLSVMVGRNATITFKGCQYTNGQKEGSTLSTSSPDVIPASADAKTTACKDGITFKYEGDEPATIEFTYSNGGTCYLHGIDVVHESTAPPETQGNGKIDVWDFGAEQLDAEKYENKLNAEVINGFYKKDKILENGAWVDCTENDDAVPGVSTSNLLGKIEEGDLVWATSGGQFTRLRSDNSALAVYDSKSYTVHKADGTDVAAHGILYSNKGKTADDYVGLRNVKKNDIITAWLTSNGTAATAKFAKMDTDGNQVGEVIKSVDIAVKSSGDVYEIVFNAPEDGDYKIYYPDEKLCVARLYREHPNVVKISGSVNVEKASGIPDGYKITFTNQITGDVQKVKVTDGKYEAYIYEQYDYKLALDGANGYVISSESDLNISSENAGEDYSLDVTIESVGLTNVSGTISGLDKKTLDSAEIVFEPTAEGIIYVPELTIDSDAMTFELKLEKDVEYNIVVNNINDYELTNPTIKYSEDKTDHVFSFKEKEKYPVTVNLTGVEDKTGVSYTFTNTLEMHTDGKTQYTYTFNDGDEIKLRNGTYEIAVNNLDKYPLQQKTTPMFKVDSEAAEISVEFNPKYEWLFTDAETGGRTEFPEYYLGLKVLSGSFGAQSGKNHATMGANSSIGIPAEVGDKIDISFYYSGSYTIGAAAEAFECTSSLNSTGKSENYSFVVKAEDIPEGYVTLTNTSDVTGYLTGIKITKASDTIEYKDTITVGADKDYTTIKDAIEAIDKMVRTDEQGVTVLIDPGNYEEMLVIKGNNITLKNASASPSIETKNKGVDIDDNAVRITSYYGHGYDYYSMGTDNKWSAEALEVNKTNAAAGKDTHFTNPGAGTTNGSYWNATVVVQGAGFKADGIIFENSFNQYISKKESEDVVVEHKGDGKGERPTEYGSTAVQNKPFVERAAALAVLGDNSEFKNCNFIGRQDTLYGTTGIKSYYVDCTVQGGTDYIFGGMIAIFDKCRLMLNISDHKDDVAYITATQNPDNQRGYLMRYCTVTSTTPGINTASEKRAKPCYFGRPWSTTAAEVTYLYTTIEESCNPGESLIAPAGWQAWGGQGKELETKKYYEYDTRELTLDADNNYIDNSASRVYTETSVLKEPKINGEDITTALYFGDWKPVYLDESAPSFKISFDAGEGTGEMPNATVDGKYNLPECEFTAPEGMEFEGWLVGEVLRNAEDKIYVTADTNITAQWKKIGSDEESSTESSSEEISTDGESSSSEQTTTDESATNPSSEQTTTDEPATEPSSEQTSTDESATEPSSEQTSSDEQTSAEESSEQTSSSNGGSHSSGGGGSSSHKASGSSSSSSSAGSNTNTGNTNTGSTNTGSANTGNTNAAGSNTGASGSNSSSSGTVASTGSFVTPKGFTINPPALRGSDGNVVTGSKLNSSSLVQSGRFNDTSSRSWAQGAINKLASMGIINGVGNGQFAPDATSKRGDFMVMLTKTLGITGTPQSSFADVPAGSYYANAINLAKDLGLASGTGDNMFNSESSISRQDMMVFAARALEAVGYDTSNVDVSVLNSYADAGSIAAYARPYVAFLISNGIVNGTSESTVSPTADMTRAQMAVLMSKLYDVVADKVSEEVSAAEEAENTEAEEAENVEENAESEESDENSEENSENA